MLKRSVTRSGLRTLGTVLPKATDPILRKRGFQNGEILSRWAEIVGPEVAEKSCPEQLSYAQGSGLGATLRVRVESTWAMDLQHLEPVIVERINTFFGHAAVSKLALIQAPLPRRDAPKPIATRDLSADEHRALDQAVIGTDDDGLRAALRALGERIAQRQN